MTYWFIFVTVVLIVLVIERFVVMFQWHVIILLVLFGQVLGMQSVDWILSRIAPELWCDSIQVLQISLLSISSSLKIELVLFLWLIEWAWIHVIDTLFHSKLLIIKCFQQLHERIWEFKQFGAWWQLFRQFFPKCKEFQLKFIPSLRFQMEPFKFVELFLLLSQCGWHSWWLPSFVPKWQFSPQSFQLKVFWIQRLSLRRFSLFGPQFI